MCLSEISKIPRLPDVTEHQSACNVAPVQTGCHAPDNELYLYVEWAVPVESSEF